MILSIRQYWLIAFSLLLSACGGHYVTQQQSNITGKLYAQYDNWQGTPYRLGGLDKKGIDCSGFVYITFKQRFGFTFPRTTKEQVKQGNGVARSKLKPGDLVFFKTGWRVRHVGIYISNGQFLHASKSKGVVISSLDNVYWQEKYWQARRIFN